MAVRLGIIIIHYNTPDDLGRCLRSLNDQPPACDHEIVVIDNASSTPGLDELQTEFPDVRWLLNVENRGYGRGCNQGLAFVAADYYLVLNPDIVVLPGALDTLLAFADQHPRAGLIGPQLLNDDGTIQESCRRFYTLWTLLLRRTPLGRIWRGGGTIDRHLMRDFDHATVRPVDWVLGGCLLVRRDALDRCGPMDERFFLYFEDVDWCYRMWQCGYEVVYLPEARFVHRHRRSSARGAFTRSFWLHLASLISFYEKWSLIVYAAKKWRRPLEIALHWSLDVSLLGVSLLGAYGVRALAAPMFDTDLLPLTWYRGWFGWSVLMVTVAFVVQGRYRAAPLRRTVDWGPHVRQMGLVALLLLAGSYLGRDDVMSRAVLVVLLGLFTLLSAWATSVVNGVHRRLEQGFLALERTLLAGPRSEVDSWLAHCGDPRRLGIDVVGYVTDDPQSATGHPALGAGDVPWLGVSSELPALVERFRVSQVALWGSPAIDRDAVNWLVRLRRSRIRLRWIVDDAWLLALGARADTFGGRSSGVLDPDSGHTLARLFARPFEIAVATPLLVVAMLLAPWRRWHRAQGRIRSEMVDESLAAATVDHSGLAIMVDTAGRPLPIWSQSSLLWALWRGRVGLVGAPLRGWSRPASPDRLLADPQAARPGLTGTWTGDLGDSGGLTQQLMTFFMNPGGWDLPARDFQEEEY